MRTPTKLGGFALITALTFGGGYAAGQLLGPANGGDSDAPDRHHTEMTRVESSHSPPAQHDGTQHDGTHHSSHHEVEP
ncbi:MAG: hypothetical protein ACRDPW_05395 [Mycobacteriales bacterium]